MTRTPPSAGWPRPPEWPPPEVPPFEPGPWPPERPVPYPPVPVVYEREPPRGDDLLERLLEQRIVLAGGVLDDTAATDIAARLMYLDGVGDEPIELRYSCHGGELHAAITLADTVELLGVDVRATAAGTVGGPALLPYAVASRRIAHPHTAFRLVEPELEVHGSATDIVADVDRHRRLLSGLYARLAAATGQPAEVIEADFSARRLLTADDARVYGLVDEIATVRGP